MSQKSLPILLAEDNPINQKLALKLLSKWGHTIVAANNGIEATQLITQEAFDLVLMDVQMPEMGEYEATKVIREQEKTTGTHIPMIAMTANVMKGDRERCLEAGMDGYVSNQFRSQIAELFNREPTHPTPTRLQHPTKLFSKLFCPALPRGPILLLLARYVSSVRVWPVTLSRSDV
jgi:CheY-like chemotaxis protein